MDKKIAGLLGAAAALTTMTAAQSAVAEQTPSAPLTYRDLLEPEISFARDGRSRGVGAKIAQRRETPSPLANLYVDFEGMIPLRKPLQIRSGTGPAPDVKVTE